MRGALALGLADVRAPHCLLPALLTLMQWGDKWVRPDGSRVARTHTYCGESITVEVRCGKGHPVTADGIEADRRR